MGSGRQNEGQKFQKLRTSGCTQPATMDSRYRHFKLLFYSAMAAPRGGKFDGILNSNHWCEKCRTWIQPDPIVSEQA